MKDPHEKKFQEWLEQFKIVDPEFCLKMQMLCARYTMLRLIFEQQRLCEEIAEVHKDNDLRKTISEINAAYPSSTAGWN